MHQTEPLDHVLAKRDRLQLLRHRACEAKLRRPRRRRLEVHIEMLRAERHPPEPHAPRHEFVDQADVAAVAVQRARAEHVVEDGGPLDGHQYHRARRDRLALGQATHLGVHLLFRRDQHRVEPPQFACDAGRQFFVHRVDAGDRVRAELLHVQKETLGRFRGRLGFEEPLRSL